MKVLSEKALRRTRAWNSLAWLGLGLLFSAPGFLAAPRVEAQLLPNGASGVGQISHDDELIKNVGITQKLNNPVPLGLAFHDETGKAVKLRDYFGSKPVMIVMVQYRCTMLCDLQLNQLTASLKQLKFTPGKEFNLLTVSIDDRETPALAAEKKKTYMDQYERPEAAAGWHFLTGDKDSIRELANALGITFVYDPKKDEFAHPDGVILLTPEGDVARYFFRLEYPSQALRLGLVEASENKIGSLLDAVALTCFHYNPKTGTYGLAIIRIVQLAGLLTIFLIGAGIWWMVRWDHRQSQPTEAPILQSEG
jgi:protein SCO1/2